MNDYEIIVTEDEKDQRLDKYLAVKCGDISRSRLQALIADGHLFVNGAAETSVKYKVQADDSLYLRVPEAEDAAPVAEDIPLDIVYEDDDVLVINKPVGLVVHPGAGNHRCTMVNALLHHCGASLSGIGGVKRPGIVHRLDKDTSGLILVAKNDKAHNSLSEQLQERSVKRVYHALCWGLPQPQKGRIDKPLGRDPKDRLKMAVRSRGGRHAVTRYKVLEHWGAAEDEYAITLVECRLETGRTHQIRVHMQSIGHPLIGDMMYGAPSSKQKAILKKGRLAEFLPDEGKDFMRFDRQALHAKAISFVHPRSGEVLSFEADYPHDLKAMISALKSIN